MCVILLAIQQNPNFPFVLAANRDEYYQRPTAPAAFWPECPDLLAGRDLEANGTWLGISRSGEIAAVTNLFASESTFATLRSRGELVSNFLQSNQSADHYRAKLIASRNQYNGYGLLFGNFRELHYLSNKTNMTTTLTGGIHALSNALINAPWPRVEVGKQLLKNVLNTQQALNLEGLFQILTNDRTAQPADERAGHHPMQSDHPSARPLFVRSSDYGTRTSTVILVDRQANVIFEERNFDETSKKCKSHQRFEFQIKS